MHNCNVMLILTQIRNANDVYGITTVYIVGTAIFISIPFTSRVLKNRLFSK